MEAVKQCSKFVECVFKSVNDSQTYHKRLASRIGRANALFLNFCVSHGSAARFLRGGIIYIYNLLLFPIAKEFSKSVNI